MERVLRDEVLALLKAREGKPLSGEEMSRALGVSRAAVWKAMESLRDEGYVISSAPRRGYALEGSPDRLSAGELAGALAGRRVGRALVCLETVDSTNNEVKRRALAGAADGLAVVAEQQTGGRGRRGRSFVSPAGQGLYLSVLLRPRCPLEEVSTLTAWTAVAVCNAVERVCGVRPGIKWPNDVILDGRKLCGILTELELEAETAALRHVVVGVGINLTQTAADFGPEVAPVAVSLARLWDGPPAGRRWRRPCWPPWTSCTPPSRQSGRPGWSGTGPTVSPWAGRCACSGRARRRRPLPRRWTMPSPWWCAAPTAAGRRCPPARCPSGGCWGMCDFQKRGTCPALFA